MMNLLSRASRWGIPDKESRQFCTRTEVSFILSSRRSRSAEFIGFPHQDDEEHGSSRFLDFPYTYGERLLHWKCISTLALAPFDCIKRVCDCVAKFFITISCDMGNPEYTSVFVPLVVFSLLSMCWEVVTVLGLEVVIALRTLKAITDSDPYRVCEEINYLMELMPKNQISAIHFRNGDSTFLWCIKSVAQLFCSDMYSQIAPIRDKIGFFYLPADRVKTVYD